MKSEKQGSKYSKKSLGDRCAELHFTREERRIAALAKTSRACEGTKHKKQAVICEDYLAFTTTGILNMVETGIPRLFAG